MKTLQIIFKIITGLSTIGAFGFAVYIYYHKDNIALEIINTSAERLTTSTPTDDLSVQYFYRDTIPVNNLWRVRYIINNIGNKTIIGYGDDKQLLNNNLPIYISKGDSIKIYKMEITQSNNGAILVENKIYFKQWRPGEFIEITALIESVNCPTLYIDDRDIIDVDVQYKPYNINASNSINVETGLFGSIMLVLLSILITLLLNCGMAKGNLDKKIEKIQENIIEINSDYNTLRMFMDKKIELGNNVEYIHENNNVNK